MNWVLIGGIVFLVIMAIVGWNRGFAKMIISLFASLIAILLVSVTSPLVMNVIRDHTKWEASISEKISDGILKEWKTDEDVEEKLAALPLPDKLRTGISDFIRENMSEGKKAALCDYMAHFILSAVTNVVLFILFLILLRLLGKSLRFLKKVPVLSQINGLLGALLGVGEGLIFISLLFIVFPLFAATGFGEMVLQNIQDSKLLSWLYNNNLVIMLFNFLEEKLLG